MGVMIALVANQKAMLNPPDIPGPDDWTAACNMGLAVYQGRGASIRKYPADSEFSGAERVRDATAFLGQWQCGRPAKALPDRADMPPFQRELFGHLWTCVGSGNLPGIESQKTTRFQPIGTSGEEHAFCMLLDSLWDSLTPDGNAGDPAEVVAQLARKIRGIRNHGQFNFLIIDGSLILAYSDAALYYRSSVADGVKLLTVTTESHPGEMDWVCLLPNTLALFDGEGLLELGAPGMIEKRPADHEPDPRDVWGLGEGDIDYNCG